MTAPGILSKFLVNCRGVLSTRISFYQQQSLALKTETKERLKSLNIPEKPKRPLTPYFRFLQHQRPTIQKEHPDWKLVEVTKRCAQDWKHLGEAVKEKYSQEYSQEVVKYENKHIDYLSLLTQEQLEALASVKSEKQKDKKKRKMRKLHRENGKPKRPIGSFSYFLKEAMANTKDKSKRLSEIMKECKVQWSNMSNDQKEKYVNLHYNDRKRYETEMNRWEIKMIEEGKIDIIRKHARTISDAQMDSSVKVAKTQKPKSAEKPKPV